jgi:hypothetical protein
MEAKTVHTKDIMWSKQKLTGASLTMRNVDEDKVKALLRLQ